MTLVYNEEQVEKWLSEYKENQSTELRNRIIEETLLLSDYLVNSIAKGANIHNHKDMKQECVFAIIRAIDKYKNNGKFRMCATWWIKKKIYDFFLNSREIRVPSKFGKKIKMINEFRCSYEEKYGFSPSHEEVYGELKFTPKHYFNLLDHESPQISRLEDHHLQEESDSFAKAEVEEEIAILNKVLLSLSERERIIINNRYGINCSPKKLKEVSVLVGVSDKRVDQIQKTAEEKILKKFRKQCC